MKVFYFNKKICLFLVSLVFINVVLFSQEYKDQNIIYHSESASLRNQQRQYEKWKKKAEKKKWTSNLFNLLFDAPKSTVLKPMGGKNTFSMYGAYEGRMIRKINIKVFKAFGGRDEKGLPTDSCDNYFEKIGNALHTKTQTKHLRNFLTIKSGDLLDIQLLEENEERIRDLSYIDELYINISENLDKSVDIDMLIKDRFEWGISHQAYDIKAHKLKVTNKNLWGRGHAIENTYRYAPEKKIEHNYFFRYFIPNLPISKFKAEFIFEYAYYHKKYEINLNRDFWDYKKKYAGGFRFNRTLEAEGLPIVSVSWFPNNINFLEYDAWIGRTIPYDLERPHKYATYKKAIALRAYRLHFTKYPKDLLEGDKFLLDTSGFLASYNVSRRRIYRSNLMYDYGRIETIPYGYLTQLLAGIIVSEKKYKNYIGFNFEKTRYNSRSNDYFGLLLSGGTLFDKDGFLEGLIKAEAKYISRLFPWGLTQYRHFFKLRYEMGLNTDNDFLNLSNSQGLHNFESEAANGTRKLVLNMENIFFTPYTLAGFRIACYSFADFGIVGSDKIKNDKFYSSIGFGLRFRNDNFIFETFQVNFSFFLKAPKGMTLLVPDSSSVHPEKFRDLRIRKPRFFFERQKY